MATPRYASVNNVFLPIPTQEIISYIRDPRMFRLPRYVSNVQSPGPNASYRVLDRHAPARVFSDAGLAWPDGSPSPSGHHNLMNFKWVPFQTERRVESFTIGNQTVKASNSLGKFDIVTAHSKMAAQQMITNRTKRNIDLLEASGNWGNNTSDATALNEGAGWWDQSSGVETDANYNAIFKSLMAAVEGIKKATNSVVQFSDLRMLVSPKAARKIAGSGEIRNYVKSQVGSQRIIEETLSRNLNEEFGLPPKLYGIEVVVEDAVIVQDVPYEGDSTEPAHTFIKGDSTAVLLTRQGALDSPFGAPNFSTLQNYWWSENEAQGGGEMDIEVRSDDWHRFTEGRCVEQYKEVLAAPESGWLITNILA